MVLLISSYLTFGNQQDLQFARIDAKYAGAEIQLLKDGSFELQLENEKDLAFVLGYNDARTHLWYLNFYLNASQGKLSEFFGIKWVKSDEMLRALQISSLSEEIANYLEPSALNKIDEYTEGLNRFIQDENAIQDLRFAKHDIAPENWQSTDVIKIWLLQLILSNPVFYEDLSLFALGLELSELDRNNLFSAIPALHPRFDFIADKTKAAQDALTIQQKWTELTNSLAIENHQLNGFDLVYLNTQDQAGFIGSRISASEFPNWTAYRIKCPNNTYEGISRSGSPFFSVLKNARLNQIWGIQQEGQSFHEIHFSNNAAEQQIRTENLKVRNSGLHLFEISYTKEGELVLHEQNQQNAYRSWLLKERFSIEESAKALNHLLNNSFNELALTDIPQIPFYQQSLSADGERLKIISPLQATSKNRPGSDSYTIFSSYNSAYSEEYISERNNSFLIAHSGLRIKNQRQFFQGWRNEPFSMEYLQTELLVLDRLTEQDIQKVISSSYSSFAVKLLQECSMVYQREKEDEDILLARSYFDNWNYLFDANATAASLFEEFYQALFRNIFEDEISTSLFKQLDNQHSFLPVLIIYILSNENDLFDDRNSTKKELRRDIIAQSLKDAILNLRREFGTQTEDWRWENYLKNRVQNYYSGNEFPSSLFYLSTLPTEWENYENYQNGHWSTINRLQIMRSSEQVSPIINRNFSFSLSTQSPMIIISN